MASSKNRSDPVAEAKKFCDGLSNVFMLKKRDAQTQHLLEQAKTIIDSLVKEKQKPPISAKPNVQPRGRAGGGII